MVRVISEKLFSPPRSRHSSGEAVDKELAARAVEALSSLNSRRLELSDYESSSDSHWDSEVDVEGEGAETGQPSESSTHGEECSGGEADVLQKRKERRRERNKLSAQAYRIRRREQGVKQQTVLRELQQKNSFLKEQVHSLEEQIDHLRRSAVIRPPHSAPSTAAAPASTPGATPTPTRALDRPQSLQAPDGAVRVGQEGRRSRPHLLVDNDLTRSQLLSPVVDNFSFSQPSPAASPAASPNAASSSSRFSFPVPSSPGSCHTPGRFLTPAMFPPAPFVPPAACPSAGERGPPVPPPHSHPQRLFPIPPPPPQHIDLNANAEEGQGNLNTIHTTAVGSCRKNDNVNNNTDNVVLAVPSLGGARPKTKAVGPVSSRSSAEVFKVPNV